MVLWKVLLLGDRYDRFSGSAFSIQAGMRAGTGCGDAGGRTSFGEEAWKHGDRNSGREPRDSLSEIVNARIQYVVTKGSAGEELNRAAIANGQSMEEMGNCRRDAGWPDS